MASDLQNSNGQDRASRKQQLVEILLVWLVFLVHAGLTAPEVNEQNYLGKARHYWNAEWCAGDFFLESSDAHLVFYWTFGWLTLLLPLPAVAVVGRVATYGLLAFGWRELSAAVVPRRGMAILSAGLLVMLNTHFHMAGEWVVGGVEAKGFAYALVFFGIAALVRDRWNLAWILLGVASALHVLIGGWSQIAGTLAWLWMGRDARPSLRSMLPGLLVGGAIAVLGVLPALGLSRGALPEVVARAWRIQVFHRLPHHLNPYKFFFAETPPYLTTFAMRFLALAVIWFVLCRWCFRGQQNRVLRGFVNGALLIAMVGMLVAIATHYHESLAARLMRFYWHRMPDVILPLGVALAVSSCIAKLLTTRRSWGLGMLLVSIVLVGGHLVTAALDRHNTPIPKADRKLTKADAARYQDWMDVGRAARETPLGARFLTPRLAHTFKWYADRGEVVNQKEMPQDAASIAEWWERLRHIHRDDDGWRPLAEASPGELRALGKKYSAGYVVTQSEPRVNLPVLHRNQSYVLYQLTDE